VSLDFINLSSASSAFQTSDTKVMLFEKA